MSYDVHWGDALARNAHEQFGPERSVDGKPSEYDFVGGPLAAAHLAFREFDRLPEAVGPTIRSVHIYDPDHWATIDDDPDA